MSLELARERINLLDIKKLDNGLWAVLYEFQYINKSMSKVWQKDILLCTRDEIVRGEMDNLIIKDAKIMRVELER